MSRRSQDQFLFGQCNTDVLRFLLFQRNQIMTFSRFSLEFPWHGSRFLSESMMVTLFSNLLSEFTKNNPCEYTLKLTCSLKRDYFNRKYIFQPLIFRGYWFKVNHLPSVGRFLPSLVNWRFHKISWFHVKFPDPDTIDDKESEFIYLCFNHVTKISKVSSMDSLIYFWDQRLMLGHKSYIVDSIGTRFVWVLGLPPTQDASHKKV